MEIGNKEGQVKPRHATAASMAMQDGLYMVNFQSGDGIVRFLGHMRDERGDLTLCVRGTDAVVVTTVHPTRCPEFMRRLKEAEAKEDADELA